MTTGDEWLDPLRAKFAVRLASEANAFRAVRDDRAEVIERAHKLAGIAGMLGAPTVGEAALALEEAARAGGDYAAAFSALIDAIEAARS